MSQVWPFPQRSELIESLEWLTDVFRAKSAEQRIALRTAPRRVFNLSHLLSDYEYSAARAMLREATTFYCPDWGQSVNVGAVAAGSSVVLGDIDYTDIDSAAMLWESPALFEQVAITITSNGAVATTVVNTYTNARLIPLWLAYAPEGLSTSRSPGQINECSIAFQVYENTDLGLSTYAQYRSHDILPTCPIIGPGSFDESVVWPVSSFDNDSGNPYYLRNRDIPDESFQMRWHEFTRQGIYELRQWLHSRRGRQKVFWMSSRGKDFEPAISIAGTTVTIYALDGILGLGRVDPFDIDITDTSGASVYRRVSVASTGTPIGGRATINMTIDTTLTLALANIQRISLLRCVRFNADRIELQHAAAGGVAVQVPVIEVSEP